MNFKHVEYLRAAALRARNRRIKVEERAANAVAALSDAEAAEVRAKTKLHEAEVKAGINAAQRPDPRELTSLERELIEAIDELVISSAFNGQVFEKCKDAHRAWTLARYLVNEIKLGKR